MGGPVPSLNGCLPKHPVLFLPSFKKKFLNGKPGMEPFPKGALPWKF